MRLHCIELPVPSPDEAGRWLESVLHFLPVDDGRLYVCGNFRLRLVTAVTRTTHPTLRKYSVWSTSVFPRTILPHHSGS